MRVGKYNLDYHYLLSSSSLYCFFVLFFFLQPILKDFNYQHKNLRSKWIRDVDDGSAMFYPSVLEIIIDLSRCIKEI